MEIQARSPLSGLGHRLRHAARIARCLPQLLARVGRHRGKRQFVQALINTYYSNYLNLSLAFRGELSDGRIRWLALRAVLVYLRNGVEYLAPRAWSGFVLHNTEALEQAFAGGRGVIVACQHLGPQRFSLLTIAQRAPKVHAAVTELFVDRLQQWLDRVEQDARGGPDAELARRVQPLPVENPACALKMVRALRRGEAVMFDVDGNIGVGGEDKTRDEAPTLSFLGRQVHVRQGVAYLSYRTGAPILPVITVWGRDGRPQLFFHQPILPAPEESLAAYCQRSLGYVYGQLEQVLRARPEQWEMWPQFFKWTTPQPKLRADGEGLETLRREFRTALEAAPETPVALHPRRAFVLRIRRHRVLIDAHALRFFQTSASREKLLRQLRRGTTLGTLARRMRGHFSIDDTCQELARLQSMNLLVRPAHT